jgi:hypothetical protein
MKPGLYKTINGLSCISHNSFADIEIWYGRLPTKLGSAIPIFRCSDP